MKAFYKIKAIAKITSMILIPLVITNGMFYLIGSFVAFSFDPSTWWIFKEWLGRVTVVIFEIGVLSAVPKFWEEFDL